MTRRKLTRNRRHRRNRRYRTMRKRGGFFGYNHNEEITSENYKTKCGRVKQLTSSKRRMACKEYNDSAKEKELYRIEQEQLNQFRVKPKKTTVLNESQQRVKKIVDERNFLDQFKRHPEYDEINI